MSRAEALGYKNYKLPFEMIAMVLHPLKGVKYIVNEETCKKIASAGKNAFVKWTELLDEEEIKDLNKEILNNELGLIKDILTLGYSEQEAKNIMQGHEMLISLKFLQSGSLEKRLNGIGDIKKMIEQVDTKGELNDELLKNWIIEHKILEKILDENTHSEIIKRSSPIFVFLAERNAIINDILETLWNCQHEKHEDIVLAIHNTIRSIVEFLPQKQIQFLYEKIKSVPLEHYDDKLIAFMKEFTRNSFDSAQPKSPSPEITSTIPKPILDSNGALVVPDDSKLYFTTLFWSLIQDDSAITAQQSAIILKSLGEILMNEFCEDFRPQYLYLCIDNLRHHKSVPQSLELAVYILSMANSRNNYNTVSAREWIKELWDNYKLFKIFMEDCENYEKLVKKYCEKTGNEDKIEKAIIVGKHTHVYNLERRFNFFERIMRFGGNDIELGRENIEKLCTLYVDNAGCDYDKKVFLSSFSCKDEMRLATFIFNPKETKIFFDILCRSRSKLIYLGLPYYKCFANNFFLINLGAYAIKFSAGKIVVLDFSRLLGMDQLWENIRYCKETTTLKYFIDLLISIYTKLDPNLPTDKKSEIDRSFVEHCLGTITGLESAREELAITNLVKLLGIMFDYVDGKQFEGHEISGHKFNLAVALQPSKV